MAFAITTLFTFLVAPPNPVTDDNDDSSNEIDSYRYPDFSHAEHPYWKAWAKESQRRLNKHDQMESSLKKLRPLDFKLREAWTKTDKPFAASH